MRVMVTGAAGMLGSALLKSTPPTAEVTGVDMADGDLTLPETAIALVAQHRPQVVIHCAAWADVDGCTRDPQRAMQVNGEATCRLGGACRQFGVRLIYLSTDYVFGGDLGRAYREDDQPRPLNPYGESKLKGEVAAAKVDNHLIVRTQWLFGPGGKNFVQTIINAGRQRPNLQVVADEWGSPTATTDLAAALWQVYDQPAGGIVHVTNQGVCNWAELATVALAAAGLETVVEPISSSDWPSPTVRPAYSPLGGDRWARLGLAPLRPWREAVTEYVEQNLPV